MSLIKKIVSCSLALSISFSGVFATATEPSTARQRHGGISSNVKKGIIAGASTLGGIGILALVGYGIWACKCKSSDNTPDNRPDVFSETFDEGFNILIIGEKEENREKIIAELKNGRYEYPSVLAPTTSLKGIVHYCMTSEGMTLAGRSSYALSTKPGGSVKPRYILASSAGDEHAASLVQQSHLIIAILDDTQESDNKIGKLLSGNNAQQHSRIITLVDCNHTVPDTPLHEAYGRDPTIKECIGFLKEHGEEPLLYYHPYLKFEHMDVLLGDYAYYWEISPQGVGNHTFYEHVSPLRAEIHDSNSVDLTKGIIKRIWDEEHNPKNL